MVKATLTKAALTNISHRITWFLPVMITDVKLMTECVKNSLLVYRSVLY